MGNVDSFTVKESTSQQQRFSQIEIAFSLRKNGGYIRSSLGGRSVLVVRQTKFLLFKNLFCNLTYNAYFGIDNGVLIHCWILERLLQGCFLGGIFGSHIFLADLY